MGTEITATVSLKNISAKPVEFKVIRTENNISSGQESYFCLGKDCFSPLAKVSIETKVLRPGEIYEGFKSNLKAGLGKSKSTVSYCFQNVADPSDEVCQTIIYQVESLRSEDVLFYNDDITISNIYPNPINEVAIWDYSLKNPKTNAKVILHNVLGGIVGEHELSEFESKLKVDTQTFKPGVYFYTLSLHNQNVITKKFVVKR